MDSKPRVIIFGVHGKAGSGKSFVGDNIAKYVYTDLLKETKTFTIPIAYHLKNVVADFYQLNNKKNIDTRKMYQDLGTLIREEIGEDFHINTTLSTIRTIIKNELKDRVDTVFIIDDVRYENELNKIASFSNEKINGVVPEVHLIKVKSNRRDEIVEDNIELKTHSSELPLDDACFEVVFENYGTAIEFEKEIITYLDKVFKDIEKDEEV